MELITMMEKRLMMTVTRVYAVMESPSARWWHAVSDPRNDVLLTVTEELNC